jgi:hypothetical protein
VNKFFIVVQMPNGSLHTIVDSEGRLATFDTDEQVGTAVETTVLCQVGVPLVFSTEQANECYPT